MKFNFLLNVLFVSAVAFDVDNFVNMFIAKRVWIHTKNQSYDLESLKNIQQPSLWNMLYDRNERSQNQNNPDDLRRLASKAIDQWYESYGDQYDFDDANLNDLKWKHNNFLI